VKRGARDKGNRGKSSYKRGREARAVQSRPVDFVSVERKRLLAYDDDVFAFPQRDGGDAIGERGAPPRPAESSTFSSFVVFFAKEQQRVV